MQFRVNKNIKRIISQKGLRQKDVAAKIGIKPEVLSNICCCKRRVYADEVTGIAKALSVPVCALFSKPECEKIEKPRKGGYVVQEEREAYRKTWNNATPKKKREMLIEILRAEGEKEKVANWVVAIALGPDLPMPEWLFQQMILDKLINMLAKEGLPMHEAEAHIEYLKIMTRNDGKKVNHEQGKGRIPGESGDPQHEIPGP